ncbi:MAG TPA: tRNA (N6-isopentenyl adenosine(37)-C2)-methylthiotransferase MiaB [Thermodesulfobacteriota bacterium]|nr:tRNA (N6-isopentenyl adenosine(37)-C2)-methylthiotransferase MiaB [Thermodesulfobacteriota bacterium]
MKDRYVFIETLGCQMNESDSARMFEFLKADNYLAADTPEKADLIFINTCSVRDKAEHKVYSVAGRFKGLKKDNPELIFGISGCVAQQEGAGLFKKIPHLDMVVGTANIHRLPALVNEVREGRRKVVETGFFNEISVDEYPPEGLTSDGVKSFVSVMRGCDNFCAYCIVPHVRGREASRPAGDVLIEVRNLAKRGVKEVTLVGQNVNSYSGGVKFTELLKMVCAVTGIERVRFVTSHPKDMSLELIRAFGEEKKLARSVHLPLQSGSDRVLELMNRGYTVEGYMEKIGLLKDLYPDISITTDIIAGFPGESDEDFMKTMDAVRKAEFDGVFSFKYSPRPMTKAASFPGQADDETKKKRLWALQSGQKEITIKKNFLLEGKTAEVLVEGVSKNSPDELVGRTSCGRLVTFRGQAGLTGNIVRVKVVDSCANSLKGEFLARTEVSKP